MYVSGILEYKHTRLYPLCGDIYFYAAIVVNWTYCRYFDTFGDLPRYFDETSRSRKIKGKDNLLARNLLLSIRRRVISKLMTFLDSIHAHFRPKFNEMQRGSPIIHDFALISLKLRQLMPVRRLALSMGFSFLGTQITRWRSIYLTLAIISTNNLSELVCRRIF